MTTATRSDVYQTVTDQIIEQLEAGVRPWAQSWTNGNSGGGGFVMPRRVTGDYYRGVNVLLLWSAAQAKGYTQSRWMTFKQALALKACVRKGEKATQIVFANKLAKEVEGENGDTETVSISYMKTYYVFNVEQIDGLGAEWFDVCATPADGPARIEAAEDFVAAVGATVRHGGDRAFFSPTADFVQMPPLAAFADAEAYYATLAHELTHWTGHQARLDRTFGKRFGDSAYAAEELVAEIGASFTCAMLGISAAPREDHAAYLASWLKVLKADKRAIFTAASAASAAADYLAERAANPIAIAA